MTTPYLLIPIFAILLMLYGISLLFGRLQIISRTTHRKIWNYLLLATFLVSGILGILMAIQVNYKLEVPWTEKVLKWHVNFGIAMATLGIFHFIWHWNYYFPCIRKNPPSSENPKTSPANALRIPDTLLPFTLGFVSIIFQTLLIRELLSLFSGNELMLAIILFVWFLLTGFGAWLGKPKDFSNPTRPEFRGNSLPLIAAIVALPGIILLLMVYLKVLLFAPGMEAGPAGFTLFLLILLMPACVVNGFAFTWAAARIQQSGKKVVLAYRLESAGAGVGGLLVTVLILAGGFSIPGVKRAEQALHPNEEIIGTTSGTAGRITLTRLGDMHSVYENGILVASSGNTLWIEEAAHFSMAQVAGAKKILVIGGSLTGIHMELMKYPVERIDFLEPDPSLMKQIRTLNLLENQSPLSLIDRDPVRHLKRVRDREYDIILNMLPGPVTLGLNRFYTSEYIKLVFSALQPSGAAIFHFPGMANYASENALMTINPVIASSRKVFKESGLLPGEGTWLVASGQKINTDILDHVNTQNIQTAYLINGYFDEQAFKRKYKELESLTQENVKANTNLHPRAFYGQINWWLGKFNQGYWAGALLGLGFLALFLVFRKDAAGSIMVLTGAGSSGLSVIVLLLMQIYIGSLYLLTGLTLAVFMIGLAAGTFGNRSGSDRWDIRRIVWVALAGMASIPILILLVLRASLPGALTYFLILVLFFSYAFASGKVFQVFNSRNSAGQAGHLYAADLAGSAVGTLIFPLVILPLAGTGFTLALVTMLGIVSLILTLRPKSLLTVLNE